MYISWISWQVELQINDKLLQSNFKGAQFWKT